MSSAKAAEANGKDRVLDAAEALFALHGYDGVTIRAIATKAGVDVALPPYYFKSKRNLFDAVFLRRAAMFNSARSEALARALDGADTSLLDNIVRAFLSPIAEAQVSSEPGWRNYCRLVALVNSSSVWVDMMTSHYDPLVSRFIDALQTALPDVERKRLYWAFHFLSGALSLEMADTGRIDRLSGGLCRSGDFEQAYDEMADFFVSGFRQLSVRHDRSK